MDRLRGILFDYGHTLVWFPKYEEAHLAAAANVRRILRDLRVSVEVSRVRALIESYVPRPNGTSVSAEEESRGILKSAGARNFEQNDLQRIIDAQWRPYIQNVRIRNGVREALEYSKMMGLKLGIVANIWSGGMNPVLARLGIEEFFDTTVADMDVGFAKPDPRIFRLALDHLQLAPEQVIMVGDNPKTDIKGAHDLGMSTVRLMRGPNRMQPDCVEADFKIRNFSTLASIIHRLIG
jgi:HAD superfamily hydrolase (TIGR01509 family)